MSMQRTQSKGEVKTGTGEVKRKKILAVSIDFDGCLGNDYFRELYQGLLKKYHNDPSKIPEREYIDAIKKANQPLFDYIAKISEGYDEVIILSGSNRLSAKKDQTEGIKNQNGSCFTALKHVTTALKERIKEPVSLNKRTIFDSILKKNPGYNFDLTEPQKLDEELIQQYEGSADWKHRLSFFQVHDLCAEHPDADITYIHAEDRDDVALPSVEVFTDKSIEEYLPTNLQEVRINQYQIENPIGTIYSYKIRAEKGMFPESLKNDIERAIDLVIQDAEILLQIKNKNSEYTEAEKKLKQLKEERAAIDNVAKIENRLLTEEEKKNRSSLVSKIISNENILEQFNNAQKLVDELPQLKESFQQIVPNNHHELNKQLVLLDKKLSSNIREKNLPEKTREEYLTRRRQLYNPTMTELGSFHRTSQEKGFLIPRDQYDAVVTECAKDKFSESKEKISGKSPTIVKDIGLVKMIHNWTTTKIQETQEKRDLIESRKLRAQEKTKRVKHIATDDKEKFNTFKQNFIAINQTLFESYLSDSIINLAITKDTKPVEIALIELLDKMKEIELKIESGDLSYLNGLRELKNSIDKVIDEYPKHSKFSITQFKQKNPWDEKTLEGLKSLQNNLVKILYPKF